MVAFAKNWLGISLLMGGGEGFPLRCLCLFPSLVKLSCLDPQLFLVFFLPIVSPILLEQGVSERLCRSLAAG